MAANARVNFESGTNQVQCKNARLYLIEIKRLIWWRRRELFCQSLQILECLSRTEALNRQDTRESRGPGTNRYSGSAAGRPFGGSMTSVIEARYRIALGKPPSFQRFHQARWYSLLSTTWGSRFRPKGTPGRSKMNIKGVDDIGKSGETCAS